MTPATFLELHAEQQWRDRAACHPDRRPEGMSRADWTAVFFPPLGGSVAQALAVCGSCPVRADCATYAENHRSGTRDGIWAGTTGRQRRRERARAGRRPVNTGYSDRERRRAVALIESGVTYKAAARRTGIPWQTIRNWTYKARSAA